MSYDSRLRALIGIAEVTVEWLTPGRRPSRKVTVPDLVGLGTREAGYAAARAGLKTAVRRHVDQPAPVEGVVVAQDLAPRARVRRGSTVTLAVHHPERSEWT